MSEYFYGDSNYAITASKPQMLEHAKELKEIIRRSGKSIELIAVNKFYKGSCVCQLDGKLHKYSIFEDLVRREYEFNGYGGDAWEQAPNLVQLKDLETGQLELF